MDWIEWHVQIRSVFRWAAFRPLLLQDSALFDEILFCRRDTWIQSHGWSVTLCQRRSITRTITSVTLHAHPHVVQLFDVVLSFFCKFTFFRADLIKKANRWYILALYCRPWLLWLRNLSPLSLPTTAFLARNKARLRPIIPLLIHYSPFLIVHVIRSLHHASFCRGHRMLSWHIWRGRQQLEVALNSFISLSLENCVIFDFRPLQEGLSAFIDYSLRSMPGHTYRLNVWIEHIRRWFNRPPSFLSLILESLILKTSLATWLVSSVFLLEHALSGQLTDTRYVKVVLSLFLYIVDAAVVCLHILQVLLGLLD